MIKLLFKFLDAHKISLSRYEEVKWIYSDVF